MECIAGGKAEQPPNEAGTPDTADPEIGVEAGDYCSGQSVRGKHGRELYGMLAGSLTYLLDVP